MALPKLCALSNKADRGGLGELARTRRTQKRGLQCTKRDWGGWGLPERLSMPVGTSGCTPLGSSILSGTVKFGGCSEGTGGRKILLPSAVHLEERLTVSQSVS